MICAGGCGKSYAGALRWGNEVVVEARCEDCYRRDFPGSAETEGFTGFTADGWRLTVERMKP